MENTTKPDKSRQLAQEQMNAIEHLLQGQSDRAVAEAVGVSRQTVWDWRNNDPLFIAELNRQRVEMWKEVRERLRSLANRALDVVALQLGGEDPKTALAAAKYVLQGTRLLGDTDLQMGGPTKAEDVIMGELTREARAELTAKAGPRDRVLNTLRLNEEAEVLAKSRLNKALAEAGLSR